MAPVSSPRLVLASASPRRRALIAQMGLTCECAAADVDETPATGEAPADYVVRLAMAKAVAVRERVSAGRSQPVSSDPVRPDQVRPDPVRSDPYRSEPARLEPARSELAWSDPAWSEPAPDSRAGRLILAADTVVTVDGAILGKPGDAAEAADMLARLSGRWHQVITGVALLGRAQRRIGVVTQVRFRAIGPEEARAYWASGEPRDKAGGYGIQGLGALFVERIEGSYSNVVGLPLFETGALLAREGLTPWMMVGNEAGTSDETGR